MPMPLSASSDLNAWVKRLTAAPVPVLAATAQEIARLALQEQEHDNVDAHMLAEAIAVDPLMTIRLLAHVGQRRRVAQITDAETVTASLVHMGLNPFFRHFSELPTAEERLQQHPEALESFQRVVRRCHRAARFALGFAVHRRDDDAVVVQEAALVHDFAELLVWYHEPILAATIELGPAGEVAAAGDAGDRPGSRWDVPLRLDTGELGQALMRAWHMPKLLIELTDEYYCHNPLVESQRQVVQWAVRLARHTADGWDKSSLGPDLEALSRMLHLSATAAYRLVRDIDCDD